MDKMTEIKALREKLAQLEREARENIREGMLVVIVTNDASLDYSLEVNDVAIISRTDIGSADGFEFEVERVLDGTCDWVRFDQIEVITKDRARELLIAEVDRKLAEVGEVGR